jgi:hypothetical protein
VLEGFGLGRGVLWVGSGTVTTVGDVQVLGKKRGGSWCCLPLLLPFSRLGSGQRGLGSTVASSRSMATGFERARTVKLTVIKICSIFILPVFDELPARDLNSKF